MGVVNQLKTRLVSFVVNIIRNVDVFKLAQFFYQSDGYSSTWSVKVVLLYLSLSNNADFLCKIKGVGNRVQIATQRIKHPEIRNILVNLPLFVICNKGQHLAVSHKNRFSRNIALGQYRRGGASNEKHEYG